MDAGKWVEIRLALQIYSFKAPTETVSHKEFIKSLDCVFLFFSISETKNTGSSVSVFVCCCMSCNRYNVRLASLQPAVVASVTSKARSEHIIS